MKTTRTFSALGLFVLLFSMSCEKRLDFEEDILPTKMVVNSFLTEGEEVRVKITASQSPLESSFEAFPTLSNCMVTLKENGVEVASTTEFVEDEYILNTPVTIGKQYEISVAHPDLENVRAQATIPPAIQNLEAEIFTGTDPTVLISFDDAPGDSYYQIILLQYIDYGDGQIVEDLLSWSTSSEYFEIDPLEGESYFYDDGFFLDDFFENGRAELRISPAFYYVYGGQYEPEYRLIIRSCSEDQYLYYRSRANSYSSSGGLFDEPVLVYGNIEGGLGIFGGYYDVSINLE